MRYFTSVVSLYFLSVVPSYHPRTGRHHLRSDCDRSHREPSCPISSPAGPTRASVPAAWQESAVPEPTTAPSTDHGSHSRSSLGSICSCAAASRTNPHPVCWSRRPFRSF
uniref:Putative secreted protein n=1 Tax=Anopheles marajoara TaxID=58244 RepID=A0A2M4C7Y6_9DIPT